MKIAIQGHPIRGHEVIQILESLGGKKRADLTGRMFTQYYFINCNGDIDLNLKVNLPDYKFYTLEEFEKEFPFKVGDKVTIITDTPHKITALEYCRDKLSYKLDNGLHYSSKVLTLYKEMKEERNITLTLEKAKEWYKKGGELKEVALQAYSEEELNKIDLPKTWEEFCDNYMIDDSEAYFDTCCSIYSADITYRDSIHDKNICPSKKSAEAHLALIQLEQLRDCYRGLLITVIGMPVWCIRRCKGRLIIEQRVWGTNETFLSFQSHEVAGEYLKNFKSLIKQAGDLI